MLIQNTQASSSTRIFASTMLGMRLGESSEYSIVQLIDIQEVTVAIEDMFQGGQYITSVYPRPHVIAGV